MEFRRGANGLQKKFDLFQDDAEFDLTKLTGVLTILWWFKKRDGTSISVSWTGAISGAKNNIVAFPVSPTFTSAVQTFLADIEVYNDTVLVLHTEESFEVDITEQAGVHTDP